MKTNIPNELTQKAMEEAKSHKIEESNLPKYLKFLLNY